MTTKKAQKRFTRDRMRVTGERYTAAARAAARIPGSTRQHVAGVLGSTCQDICEADPDEMLHILVSGCGGQVGSQLPRDWTRCQLSLSDGTDTWSRRIDVPVLDWDGETDESQPDGAVIRILLEHVVPWLRRHEVAVDEFENPVLPYEGDWFSPDFQSSLWRCPPEHRCT
jgi:hypothetical protein